MTRFLALIPLAAAAVAALAWSQWRSSPYAVSGIIEADDVRVGSRVGGRVAEVRAVEGQRVRAGEVLLTFEPYDLRESLAEARALHAARQATLARLEAGFRSEEIEQARARRDRLQAVLDALVAGPRPLEIQILDDRARVAEAELRDAQREYDRIRPLFESGEASRQEMETAAFSLQARQAAAAAAQSELALAREGTRAEEIAGARAALAEAEAALALLERGARPEEIDEARAQASAAASAVAAIERRLEELEVRAPRDAVVEALDLLPGDLIAPNAAVASLIDPVSLWVRAYLPERRLDVQVGRRVLVRVDSLPQRRFAGRVAFVSRQAEFTPSNVQTPEERSKQVFRIKVVLEEGVEALRAGMAADVYIDQEPP